MTPPGCVYEFGQFRLETAERRLLRGPKRVWPDAFVEEANVARQPGCVWQ